MNAITLKVFYSFTQEMQSLVHEHARDDIDELVQQVALELLRAQPNDTAQTIFARARSAVRRFTQDVAHYAREIDEQRDEIADERDASALTRADCVREIAEREHITLRASQMRVKKQVERARLGDLFAGDAV